MLERTGMEWVAFGPAPVSAAKSPSPTLFFHPLVREMAPVYMVVWIGAGSYRFPTTHTHSHISSLILHTLPSDMFCFSDMSRYLLHPKICPPSSPSHPRSSTRC